jgi:Flp pilus assembly pilin Flp
MYKIALNYIFNVKRRLVREEDGLALTEYLILLALLAGAVAGAVIIFGGTLEAGWNTWATWLSDLPEPDPIVADGGTTDGGTTDGGTTDGGTTDGGTTDGGTTGG